MVARAWLALFVVSAVALFLELALIRYCSSQIRIFAFFKNVPLIGAFLGEAVVRKLPFVKVIYSVSKQVVAAGQGEGFRAFRSVVFVEFPRPGMRAVGFVTATFAFGETACSVLVAPPDHTPLAVRFFTLIHYGIYSEAAAVVVLTVLAVLLPAGLVTFLMDIRKSS